MIRPTCRAAAFAAVFVPLAACVERDPDPGSSGAAADIAAIREVLVEVERTFNAGDLEPAMDVFTADAVIIGQGSPDIAGAQAIREMYAAMMTAFDIDAALTTEEIEVVGDLAYERGSYTLKLTDKASGQVVADLENRHIHLFKRQPDGTWKTWRMMVNNTTPIPGGP